MRNLVQLCIIGAVICTLCALPTEQVDAQSTGSTVNTSAPAGLEYLIYTSFRLDGNATVNCVNDGPTEDYCNMTAACYWNSTMKLCVLRGAAASGKNDTVIEPVAWCAGHFPTPLIATIYMIGTFVMGFALSGVVYNALWYDVYSRVNDSGERQFNQFFMSTAPMNLYCIFIVVDCFLMYLFTFVNLVNEKSCVYVAFTYFFIIGFFVPALAIPTWYLVVWIMKKCTKPPQTDLTLDEWCVPPTESCQASPAANQVRCF